MENQINTRSSISVGARFWLLLVWLSAVFFSAASDASSEGVDPPQPYFPFEVIYDSSIREVRITGILNAQLADQLQNLEQPVSSLIVTSRGGDDFAATSIARLANQNNWTVRFQGICASACISLFLQTREAEVSADVLFLAHSTIVGRIGLITKTDEWRRREALDLNGDDIYQATHYIDQLRRYQRDALQDYHRETTAAIGPLCAGGITHQHIRLAERGQLLFRAEYEYWLPKQASLDRWRSDLPEAQGLNDYDSELRQRLAANLDMVHDVTIRHLLADDQVQIAGEWYLEQDSFDLCDQIRAN